MDTFKIILPGSISSDQYFRYLIITMSIVLIASACNEPNFDSQIADIQAAEEQWKGTNIQDYQAEVEQICFCPPPFRYTMVVEDGEIVQIRDSETGDTVEHIEGYSTIDERFTWLKQIAPHNPQKLELEFNSDLGYPTLIDYNQSNSIADEELFFQILDFHQR